MTFPEGWTPNIAEPEWVLVIEPSASALSEALMSLPGATIIRYIGIESLDFEPITRVIYYPSRQEAFLS